MSEGPHTTAHARRPTEFDLAVWWRVLKRVAAGADRRNLGLVAAGVAFYALLSVFPAIAAMIAVWGFVADPGVIAGQLDMVRQLLPTEAFDILEDQVRVLIKSNDSTLQLTSLVSILLAVWTAKNGVAALIRGLNSVYSEKHRQNPVRRYAIALGLTVLLIAVALIAVGAVVIVPMLLGLINIPVKIELAITVVNWLILLGLVLLSIGVLYRYGPNRRGARVRWITPGALVALVVWAAVSVAFSVYLRNFGSFNEVYGSIGAVIALLFWFYLSAYVLLLGAQLNAELELHTEIDSTIGEDRPGGERDAYVADFVVDANGETRLAEVSPERDENH